MRHAQNKAKITQDKEAKMKQIQYPKTPKEDIVEILHGQEIRDPYRWLEDDKSPKTEAWLKEQHALTDSILNRYPGRKAMLDRLTELSDYPKQSIPYKRGDWYYIYRNTGLQNQSVIYRRKKDGAEELFFDPNTLSEDGTTTCYISGASKDKRYFCFNIAPSGADDSEYWVMDTESKTFLKDKITDVQSTSRFT